MGKGLYFASEQGKSAGYVRTSAQGFDFPFVLLFFSLAVMASCSCVRSLWERSIPLPKITQA